MIDTEYVTRWQLAPPEAVGDPDPTDDMAELVHIWQTHGSGQAPRVVVDYGCGTGRLTAPLAEWAGRVVAADPNPTFLGSIPPRRNVEKVLIAGAETGWRPADLVVASRLLIHMSLQATVTFLRDAVAHAPLVAVHLPLYDTYREAEHWSGVQCWTAPMLEAVCHALGVRLVESWASPGSFDHAAVGPNHLRFQVVAR